MGVRRGASAGRTRITGWFSAQCIADEYNYKVYHVIGAEMATDKVNLLDNLLEHTQTGKIMR